MQSYAIWRLFFTSIRCYLRVSQNDITWSKPAENLLHPESESGSRDWPTHDASLASLIKLADVRFRCSFGGSHRGLIFARFFVIEVCICIANSRAEKASEYPGSMSPMCFELILQRCQKRVRYSCLQLSITNIGVGILFYTKYRLIVLLNYLYLFDW